jgi:ubiquinone biosynthesis accessory factor UbiK
MENYDKNQAPVINVRRIIPIMVHGGVGLAQHWCAMLLRYLSAVIDAKFFEELRSRIDQTLRNSPTQDIEKNLRALLSAWFDRLNLVLREDFEVQKKLLERAQAKLAELEARITELEARKPR